MSSLSALQFRALAAKGVVAQINDDQDAAIKLKYVGSGTVTSVTVTTATDITMVTSDGGTDAYTWAGYTTLGALVDKINTDGIFQAKVMDGLRATATGANIFTAGAITADAKGEYSMLYDTTYSLALAYRLTYDRTFGTSQKFRDLHRVHLQEIVTNITCGGGADANSFKIYECAPDSRGSTETLLYTKTPTSGSSNTTSWASGEGKLTASEGNDLVVVITDGTSITGSLTVSGILE